MIGRRIVFYRWRQRTHCRKLICRAGGIGKATFAKHLTMAQRAKIQNSLTAVKRATPAFTPAGIIRYHIVQKLLNALQSPES